MEKLHYNIIINATREKVWKTMLEDKTYREWTSVFNPSSGSYFEGDWSEGSAIRFLGPSEGGSVGGMSSMIEKSMPYEFMSIKHLGEIQNGVDQVAAGKAQPWKDAHENYTFKEVEGGTEVLVDLDSPSEYKGMFEEMWPKALLKLKEITERT